MDICRLKMRICKLEMCICRLKTEFVQGFDKFFLGEWEVLGRQQPFFCFTGEALFLSAFVLLR